MSKPLASEPQRSSTIESGSGRLQLKNERALIQIRGITNALAFSMQHELKTSIFEWLENEERMNKENGGEYSISWRKLIGITENATGVRQQFFNECSDFREYVEGVESGQIVPTPTPPATSTVVIKQQGETSQGVAAIYGQRKVKES